MAEIHVLIIDDDMRFSGMLRDMLELKDYTVETANTLKDGLRLVKKNEYDMILADLMLPDGCGMDILKTAHSRRADATVIMITAFSTVDTAVQAMKLGAYDYIKKGSASNDELGLAIDRAAERVRMLRQRDELHDEVASKYGFQNIIEVNTELADVFKTVKKAASKDVTILIRGESGTGKEIIAKAVHYYSPRRTNPLVVVNCSAIPSTLLESEIFGHEKGSFTGATQKRLGKFELANKGSIFLDEIGDMQTELQAKFLRVLENQEFERVGGDRPVKVDVRIIAATNRNLEEDVKKGKFREDLYYRLNVYPIYLPPLRERKKDIPFLAKHFLRLYAKEYSKNINEFTDEAFNMIMSYDWPGNVRELENCIKGAVVNCESGKIGLEDMPVSLEEKGRLARQPAPGVVEPPGDVTSLEKVVESVEKKFIMEALQRNNWVRAKAARELGLTERILGYKVKKYGMEKPGV